MGAQGLRCLTRYPSVLPGLALAKTQTHHRDGTGCWGREMSRWGSGIERQRNKKGKEKEEKEKKAGWGRDRGKEEMGEVWGIERRRQEKAKKEGKNYKARTHLEKRGRRGRKTA